MLMRSGFQTKLMIKTTKWKTIFKRNLSTFCSLRVMQSIRDIGICRNYLFLSAKNLSFVGLSMCKIKSKANRNWVYYERSINLIWEKTNMLLPQYILKHAFLWYVLYNWITDSSWYHETRIWTVEKVLLKRVFKAILPPTYLSYCISSNLLYK